MRFLELRLIAFGPFTDYRLDFSERPGALHVIYGRNEAGKSTALRAISSVLYGIPRKTQDAHRHDIKALRIGAKLARPGSAELEILRLRRERSSLCDASGEPLDEMLLANYLGGVGERLFGSMFGLDHEGLRRGAEALLQDKGDLGESLFDAGHGGRAVREVLADLQAQAQELYRARASTSAIGTSVKQYRKARNRARELALHPKTWANKKRELDRIKTDRTDLETARAQLVNEQRRLRRLQLARPVVLRYRTLSEEARELDAVPALPEDARKRRQRIERTLEEAGRELTQTTTARLKLEGRLEALGRSSALNAASARDFSELEELLALERVARRQRPELQQARERLRAEARALAAELGTPESGTVGVGTPEPELFEAKSRERAAPRAPGRAAEHLKQLAQQHVRLAERLADARRGLAEAEARLNFEQGRLVELDAAGTAQHALELDTLAALLRTLGDENVAYRQAEARRALRELEFQLEHVQGELGFWAPGIALLARAPLPPLESVLRHEQALLDVRQALEQSTAQQRETQDAILELEREIECLTLEGAVPTEEQLALLREKRNSVLSSLENAWLGSERAAAELVGRAAESAPNSRSAGAAPTAELPLFALDAARNERGDAERQPRDPTTLLNAAEPSAAAFDDVRPAPASKSKRGRGAVDKSAGTDRAPAASALLATLREAMTEADLAADRLRREASRVAALARLLSERHARQKTLTLLEAQLITQREALNAGGCAWRELFAPLGVEPPEPLDMRAWLERAEQARRVAQELEQLRAQVQSLDASVEALREQLLAALKAAGVTSDLRALPLVELTTRCNDKLQALRRDAGEREARQKSVEQAQTQRHAAQALLVDAQAQLAEWRRQFGAAAVRAGLPRDLPPEEASTCLDALRDLALKRREIERAEHDLARLASESTRLEQCVRGLCKRHAPDLEPAPLEQAASELLARFEQSRTLRSENVSLAEERAELIQREHQLELSLTRARAELAELLRLAGVEALEDLKHVEQRAERAVEVRKRCQELREQLEEVREDAPLEELVAEASALTPSELERRLGDVTASVSEAEQRHLNTSERIADLHKELDRLSDSAAASEALSDSELALAKLRAQTESYVELRIAAIVLAREIERYREQNQGPIVTRANELFPRLTLGHYKGVRADYGMADEAQLLCERANGELVGVEGLSEGARDQLYLALRLASLERYGDRAQILPLVLDDILIHFDDERARATLSVLGEFAQKTQVLFFTHHRRLVELAHEAVPALSLVEHRLERPDYA